MLMPAVSALRVLAEVVLVGRSPGLSFLRPYVNEAYDFEGPRWSRLFLEDMPPVSPLTDNPIDCAVVFITNPDNAFVMNLRTMLPGTPIRFFPGLPPEGEPIHSAYYLARCLEEAGCPLDVSKAFAAGFERALLSGEGSIAEPRDLVFHPGSGSKKKNLPPEFWVEIATAFMKKGFRRTAVLIGPAEDASLPFYEQRLEGSNAEIILRPETEKLLSILKGASLYLGHDSGITHLAAMLGTPTIALFKDSCVRQWRPIGPLVRVIASQDPGPALLPKAVQVSMDLLGKLVSLWF